MTDNTRFIENTYLRALFPTVIGVLGGTVNAFIDGILVGQKLGETGIESINESMPLYLLFCTFGSLIASGCFFLSAKKVGEKKREEGERYFSQSVVLAVIIGIALTVICSLINPWLSKIFSTASTYEMVSGYLRVTCLGAVFNLLMYIPAFYLRLQGKNRAVAVLMGLMIALNISFDLLFIYVTEWGVNGAALASVGATSACAVIGFVLIFSGKTKYRFQFSFPKKGELKEIIKFGSPMALNNVLAAASVLAINLILKSTAIGKLLVIYAVINSICEFSVCIQNGVPQAASSMSGVFFGERDYAAVRKLLGVELKTAVILSLFFGFTVSVFSKGVADVFGSSEDIRFACICFAVALVFASVNACLLYHYNVVENTRLADMIVVLKGFILLAGFCFAFRSFGEKIWLFYPFAEGSAFVIALIASAVVGKKKGLSKLFLLKDSQEKLGKAITFAVENTPESICEASAGIRDFCDENEFTPKQAMAISLSIEEMLTMISQKALGPKDDMNVRVLKDGDGGVVRIRAGGKMYNPIEELDDSLEYMGVAMIVKLAKKTDYQNALGINTLIITI